MLKIKMMDVGCDYRGDQNTQYKVEKMLKKMPGLDKSKEDSRSITTIQVKVKM